MASGVVFFSILGRFGLDMLIVHLHQVPMRGARRSATPGESPAAGTTASRPRASAAESAGRTLSRVQSPRSSAARPSSPTNSAVLSRGASPRAWQKFRPRSIWYVYDLMSMRSKGPSLLSRNRFRSLSRNSKIRYSLPSFCSTSLSATMFGCCSSFRSEISLSAVDGMPSSSSSKANLLHGHEVARDAVLALVDDAVGALAVRLALFDLRVAVHRRARRRPAGERAGVRVRGGVLWGLFLSGAGGRRRRGGGVGGAAVFSGGGRFGPKRRFFAAFRRAAVRGRTTCRTNTAHRAEGRRGRICGERGVRGCFCRSLVFLPRPRFETPLSPQPELHVSAEPQRG